MSQLVISNPIINSPSENLQRHFRLSEEGIRDQIVSGGRHSGCFVPITQPNNKDRDKWRSRPCSFRLSYI